MLFLNALEEMQAEERDLVLRHRMRKSNTANIGHDSTGKYLYHLNSMKLELTKYQRKTKIQIIMPTLS